MSELPTIGRALFLKIRCAYIRTMAARGESPGVIVNACNLHDETQARLIAMTEPGFDDGTVNDEVALLSEMAGLDALADRLASFAAEKLAAQRDAALSKVAELERELASERRRRIEAGSVVVAHREVYLKALYNHRATLLDVLDGGGDAKRARRELGNVERRINASEAAERNDATPQVSQEGGGNGEG